MGNCAAPKQSRNGAKGKMELKQGEQIINYNGKSYKINLQDIYQKKENEQTISQNFQFLQKQHCSSIILDSKIEKKHAPTRDNSILHVNGKNLEFVLQNVQTSSLHARRCKYSLNDIPTANLLSPCHETQSPTKFHQMNSIQYQHQIHAN